MCVVLMKNDHCAGRPVRNYTPTSRDNRRPGPPCLSRLDVRSSRLVGVVSVPARRPVVPARHLVVPARHPVVPARHQVVPARRPVVPAQRTVVPARRCSGKNSDIRPFSAVLSLLVFLFNILRPCVGQNFPNFSFLRVLFCNKI